jgi:hypothetical protein
MVRGSEWALEMVHDFLLEMLVWMSHHSVGQRVRERGDVEHSSVGIWRVHETHCGL